METPRPFPATTLNEIRTADAGAPGGATAVESGVSMNAAQRGASGPDVNSSQGTPFEPEVTDDLGLTEDDKTEDEEPYWYWDDNDVAREVCQKRRGPL